ncbi:MAG: lipase family protein [Scytonema hyalinum WJT4-NPBG1]|jgi:hypothetical protein|nr:lipase family protein [Scytonema hyalinum WJT4-NPBG1]
MNSHILTPKELELSLILAQASSFIYYKKLLFNDIEARIGIFNVKTFNFNSSNQYCISGFLGYYKDYIVIVFKGTDCNHDWIKNFDFLKNSKDFNGQVHSGFAKAILNNWNDILNITQTYFSHDKKILLTGHSLGGALAILAAAKFSYIPQFNNKIEAVYTYGAPRVGDEYFESQYTPTHYRFEYGNDPVPSSPSLGYIHTGEKHYLPKNQPTIRKDIQSFEAYQTHIRLASVVVNLFVNPSNFLIINDSIQHINGVFDDVSDHNIEKYIQHLQNYKHFIVILKGLQDETLKRHGSVIKDSETGNIVCFLLEAPQKETNHLPLSLISKGAFLAINGVGEIPLQMSSLATGASVLNLGISLAAFAHMNKKLNQIQLAINNLQPFMAEGFNRIEDRLEILCFHVEQIQKQQDNIFEEIYYLRQERLNENISTLKAAVETKISCPDIPNGIIFNRIFELIDSFSTKAQIQQPALSSRSILLADIAMKGWASATAILAYFLLENGQIDKAENLLNNQVTEFRNTTRKWAANLINHKYSEIATAYRFTAPVFKNKNITREQVDRIAYISPVDQGLSKDEIEEKRDYVQIAFKLTENREELNNPEWIETQIFVVKYLDTLSELLARLESLLDFTHFCKSKGVSIHDILPDHDAEPGLYLQFYPVGV